ncbi:MAG: type VII toxin-antitoxin system HepT family RNase toxin [Sulfuricurvum sp.]
MKMTFHDYLAKTRVIATQEKEILDELYQQITLNGSLDGIQSRAAERSLQIMIENLIGRCKKILQHYDSPIIPLSGYDSAEILKNVGFFEDEEFSAMRRLFGFRNAIVHDYMDLDRLIVKAIVEMKTLTKLFKIPPRLVTVFGVARKELKNA